MTVARVLIQRLHRAASWLALPILLTLAFAGIVQGDSATHTGGAPQQLVGATVRYAAASGDYIQKTFVDDSHVRWKLLSGPHAGDEGTDKVLEREVAPGIYFVSTLDAIGDRTISEVFNLTTLMVSVVSTSPDPGDPMQRTQQASKSRLELVNPGDGGDGGGASMF